MVYSYETANSSLYSVTQNKILDYTNDCKSDKNKTLHAKIQRIRKWKYKS